MKETKRPISKREPMSKTRRKYVFKLVFRCIIFVACILLLIFKPEEFQIIEQGGFFKEFSLIHLLWIIWIIDMLLQVIPIKDALPLGSQKHFAVRFKEIKEKINYQFLKEYVTSTTKAAYKVFLIWVLLLAVLGVLYFTGVINNVWLFMISVLFYVCDLICVLIWCPFRLIMKNKCCTTCRIFNWDHMMMFTPMVFILSEFAVSLILIAAAAWVVWEACVMIYPERFWERSNASLKCSECTDKLCTQYCRKLKK